MILLRFFSTVPSVPLDTAPRFIRPGWTGAHRGGGGMSTVGLGGRKTSRDRMWLVRSPSPTTIEDPWSITPTVPPRASDPTTPDRPLLPDLVPPKRNLCRGGSPPSEPSRTGGVGTYTNRGGIHRIAPNPRVQVVILVGGWQNHRRRPPSAFDAPTNGVAQRRRTERNASRNRDTEAGTVASCACVVRACHRRTNATTCGVVEDERHVERHPHRPRGG